MFVSKTCKSTQAPSRRSQGTCRLLVLAAPDIRRSSSVLAAGSCLQNALSDWRGRCKYTMLRKHVEPGPEKQLRSVEIASRKDGERERERVESDQERWK